MAHALSKKMRTRRDRLYIIAEILNLAKHEIPKTQIMYDANLSFTSVNEYLPFLLETKLISATTQNGKTVYKVTSDGMKYLRNYAMIKDLAKIGRKHIVESQPARKRMDAVMQPEKASYVVAPNSENIISRVEDIDTRLRLVEMRLSDFLSKNPSYQYCPYCGKGLDKQKRRIRNENRR